MLRPLSSRRFCHRDCTSVRSGAPLPRRLAIASSSPRALALCHSSTSSLSLAKILATPSAPTTRHLLAIARQGPRAPASLGLLAASEPNLRDPPQESQPSTPSASFPPPAPSPEHPPPLELTRQPHHRAMAESSAPHFTKMPATTVISAATNVSTSPRRHIHPPNLERWDSPAPFHHFHYAAPYCHKPTNLAQHPHSRLGPSTRANLLAYPATYQRVPFNLPHQPKQKILMLF